MLVTGSEQLENVTAQAPSRSAVSIDVYHFLFRMPWQTRCLGSCSTHRGKPATVKIMDQRLLLETCATEGGRYGRDEDPFSDITRAARNDMTIVNAPRHRQIGLSATVDRKQIVPVINASKEDRARDRTAYDAVNRSTPQPGYNPDEETISAHPILSDKSFVVQLQAFHKILIKAVVNIVDRWWEDHTAGFPSRMPLEPAAEEVLKWIDQQSKGKSMPAFADCLGNWRPDFLLTDNEKPSAAPGIGFQICEINSRSPINAILHSAAKHAMMRKMLGSNSILELAGEYDTMANSLLGSFDLNLPIHVVRGRDALERKEFRCLAEKKTGMFPRLVSISDLQLLPDSSSATGYALYCSRDEPKNGESKVERVHQVLLTLFPEEFGLLSQEMLRHLAKVAVNDFRTILFVNDQRFLGIILQEVDNLVAHHQILTPEEGQILREGIVPTVLPGSPELSKMVASNRDQWENVKDRYILKAARESRGRGHLLGAEVSIAEWNAILLEMQDPSIRADTTSYVLQPYVQQPEFDVVAGEDTTVPESRIVGTYYSGNGHYIGLGPWRSGSGRICNIFGGSCVLVMSVTTADI